MQAAIGIASQALGIAEAAYEAARQYAGQREAFGQTDCAFQGTGFKIADMKTRIEASRLLIYNAAIAKENSKKTGGVIHWKHPWQNYLHLKQPCCYTSISANTRRNWL